MLATALLSLLLNLPAIAQRERQVVQAMARHNRRLGQRAPSAVRVQEKLLVNEIEHQTLSRSIGHQRVNLSGEEQRIFGFGIEREDGAQPLPDAHIVELRKRGAHAGLIVDGVLSFAFTFALQVVRQSAGLSAIGAPTSSGVLLSLAQSAQAPLNVRLMAVHGVPGVLASSQVPAALQPILESSESGGVRAAAAEVLGRHGGCGLVRAQARRERDALTLQRALQICDNR